MIWFLTILIFVSIAGNLYFLTIIKQSNMGSINETITAFTARINAATNEVANDIKNWKAAFESGNVTPEILADMDAKVAALEALAAEDSPVPVVPVAENTPVAENIPVAENTPAATEGDLGPAAKEEAVSEV